MLTMVMENPTLFTIVRDVPRVSGGALCATKVEKRGESAITTRPQKNKKAMNTAGDTANRNRGEARQQTHDNNNASVANFLAPKRWEKMPLITQATPPEAIMRKDTSATLSLRITERIGSEHHGHKSPERVQLPHVPKITKRGRPEIRLPESFEECHHI